jgi:microcystin-dependent protein
MKKRNWSDLARKLVDRFDMLDTLQFIQDALGSEALASWGAGIIDTQTYPYPFVVTLSGSNLGGSVSPGRAYNPQGQIIQQATLQNFALTSDSAQPRRALLVIRHKFTGDTLIPKPSDPILNVFLNLHDDYELEVLLGIPAASPAYPAKGANDIILQGFLIPAGATLGTQCTLDADVREVGFRPATRVSVDQTLLKAVSQKNLQLQTEKVDLLLQHAALALGARPIVHDQVEVTLNSGGVQGDTLTLAGTTLTFGNNPNEIPLQLNSLSLAFALARTIRDHPVLGLTFTAAASNNVVTIYALTSGPNGAAISETGTTVTLGAATLAGNRSRYRINRSGVQAQLDQLDEHLYKLLPPGTFIDFGGNVVPEGFLACNGAAVSRTQYAALFAAIGTRWGQGDGSTTFHLPQQRGYYRRGWDNGAGVDPDRNTRFALFPGGATGDDVGSYQGPATKTPNSNFSTDATGSHTHPIHGVGDHSHFYVAPFGDQGSLEPDGVVAADEPEYGNNTGGAGAHSHGMDAAGSHTHAVTGGGDAETRGWNSYVLVCIKT